MEICLSVCKSRTRFDTRIPLVLYGVQGDEPWSPGEERFRASGARVPRRRTIAQASASWREAQGDPGDMHGQMGSRDA